MHHDDSVPIEQVRIPPNELDAEAAVLSAMILDPTTIDIVQGMGLASDHFYADANRWICHSIFEIHATGSAVDTVTVASFLRSSNKLLQIGGTAYLAQISDATPAIANVQDHAELIRDKWRVRCAINACKLGQAEGYANPENTQQYLEGLEQALSDLTELSARVALEPIGKIIDREVVRIGRAKEEGLHIGGFLTGFGDLDKLTGGLFPTDLIVVGARPGIGKTSFLTGVACSLAKKRKERPGYGVALFSLEMERTQLAMRIACHEAEIDFSKLRSGTLQDQDWNKLLNAADELRHAPIWIDDPPTLTIPELRARVRKLKREIESGKTGLDVTRLALVGVDYLQLMKGVTRSGTTREQEVASLSRGLKGLAKEENLPIMALSQLSRYVERHGSDKRPGLADLRESGAIEQDADDVWFLYREAYYDPTTAKKNIAEVIVSKARNGATGMVELHFTPHLSRFYNSTNTYEEPDDAYWGTADWDTNR